MSVSEKRLSSNSEQLLAFDFGIAPGATKSLTLRPPKLDQGSLNSLSGSGPGQLDGSAPDGIWVLGGQIPSPNLHLSIGEEGSVSKTGTNQRWSLKKLVRSEDGLKVAESMHEFGSATRPSIPPRGSSLSTEVGPPATETPDSEQ